MYEFVDVYGERVTVRSVRTLSGLLQRGTIVATTPFRRAEDASFGPAAKHPELLSIAAQLGVAWDGAGGTLQRAPDPVSPSPAKQPASAGPIPRAPKPSVARTSVPLTMPAAIPPHQVHAMLPGREQLSSADIIVTQRRSPWSRVTPAVSHRRSSAKTLAVSVGIVLLNLASAAVLGALARFVVTDATGSHVLAIGSMLIVMSLAGSYAGRIVANQVPPPSGRAVCLATAVFAMGCYEVAGVFGLVITAAAVTPLWSCLSNPRR